VECGPKASYTGFICHTGQDVDTKDCQTQAGQMNRSVRMGRKGYGGKDLENRWVL